MIIWLSCCHGNVSNPPYFAVEPCFLCYLSFHFPLWVPAAAVTSSSLELSLFPVWPSAAPAALFKTKQNNKTKQNKNKQNKTKQGNRFLKTITAFNSATGLTGGLVAVQDIHSAGEQLQHFALTEKRKTKQNRCSIMSIG